MVSILMNPFKLPWNSHLSTFRTEGGKGGMKGGDTVNILLILGNIRIKLRVVRLKSNLILEKETIST